MSKCDLNYTLAWVFSCKFAAYFQNTFFQEHLRVASSEAIYRRKLHKYLKILGFGFLMLYTNSFFGD